MRSTSEAPEGAREAIDLPAASFRDGAGRVRASARALPEGARAGDVLYVTDGSGALFACRIENIDADQALLVAARTQRALGAPRVRISLFVDARTALEAPDAIAAAAEAGASTVIAYSDGAGGLSLGQSRAIGRGIDKAAKLAGREGAALDTLRGEGALMDALCSHAAPIVLWEGAEDVLDAQRAAARALGALRAAHGGPSGGIALLVGPDRGIERRWALRAGGQGALLRTLGSSLLRPQTAAVCAVGACALALEAQGACAL